MVYIYSQKRYVTKANVEIKNRRNKNLFSFDFPFLSNDLYARLCATIAVPGTITPNPMMGTIIPKLLAKNLKILKASDFTRLTEV